MSAVRSSDACNAARSQVSRQLDGDISQLEGRMLAAHLARCADCRLFAADVERFTRELRAAPLVPVSVPIAVGGSRRRLDLARVQLAVAAAVAVTVIATVMQMATSRPTSGESFRTPTQYPTSIQTTREVRQIIADGREFKRPGAGSNWAT